MPKSNSHHTSTLPLQFAFSAATTAFFIITVIGAQGTALNGTMPAEILAE